MLVVRFVIKQKCSTENEEHLLFTLAQQRRNRTSTSGCDEILSGQKSQSNQCLILMSAGSFAHKLTRSTASGGMRLLKTLDHG